MEPKNLAEIKEFRKEIEADLIEMLDETDSDFTLDDIKDVILNEKETDDMQKVIAMFDNGDSSNLSNVLELVSDAWNYFPHKILGGLSPAEKLLEYDKKNPKKTQNNDKVMPKVRVGDREMSWDAYETMLTEMEKVQEPFKKWIAGVLKDYKSSLEKEGLSKKMIEKHNLVAETFFDRVLWLGWFDFASIRPAFISTEFPKWWKAHVISSGINDHKEVQNSVGKLARFVEERYKLK